MSNFEMAIDFVLKNEGGLVDSPHDAGGITNYGISFRFLKSLSPESLKACGIYEPVCEQTIRDLSLNQAKLIYQNEFWNHAPFEKIGNQEIVNYIFDMAINMGIAPAIKCVQRAIWAVMKRIGLKEDGIMGTQTLMSIQACGFLLLPAIRSERAGYYRLIAQSDVTQVSNLNGWLNRAYESN